MVLADAVLATVPRFLLGFVLAVLLVPVCRRLARRTGVVAHPRADRWHRAEVPMLGGVAIAAAVLAGSVLTGIAADAALPLLAAMAIFVVGLVDDVVTLKPAAKLVAQIALAAALVYAGYRLLWFESRLLDSLLTIVWLVGLTNAFNLLDNMDGLCAGTALVVSVMLIVGLQSGVMAEQAGPELAFLAVLAGAVTGFLAFNFPPASIFMGDSGSLLIGFSLATLTLSNEGVRASRSDILSAIAAPVFVLLLPIFDTTLVTVMRLLSGRSPAAGGLDHSSHRLVAMGLSERTALIVLWSLSAAGGVMGLMLRGVSQGWSLPVGALFAITVGLFAVYLARVRVYDEEPAAGAARGITPLLTDFMYKRRVAEVLLDFCLIAIAFYAANRLRFEGEEYLRNADTFYQTLPVLLAAQLLAFFVVGVYRGTWHYFGLMDGVTIGTGVVLGTALAQVTVLILQRGFTHSRAVFVIYAVLAGALVTAARASLRLMGEFVQRRRQASRRAVIYGATGHTAAVLRELYDAKGPAVRVVGFIDDSPWMARTAVQGYRVLGGYPVLEDLVRNRGVDTVILNGLPIGGDRLAELEALCREHSVSLLQLQVSMEQLISPAGESPASRLRAVTRK